MLDRTRDKLTWRAHPNAFNVTGFVTSALHIGRIYSQNDQGDCRFRFARFDGFTAGPEQEFPDSSRMLQPDGDPT
jgi:hypothetical protein